MYVLKELKDNENNSIINLSFINDREKYFSLQKIMTFVVLILGMTCWIEPLLELFKNINLLFIYIF